MCCLNLGRWVRTLPFWLMAMSREGLQLQWLVVISPSSFCTTTVQATVRSPARSHSEDTAFGHTEISRIIGASGIHVGTMSFGKMEGDALDKLIAYMLQGDMAQGPTTNRNGRA